jgi:ribose-phosphate pyrophosphokinase
VNGKTVLIIDDICDGGKTFLELGKKLKELGAKSVLLHVTHGIFSKGRDAMFPYVDVVTAKYDWTVL